MAGVSAIFPSMEPVLTSIANRLLTTVSVTVLQQVHIACRLTQSSNTPPYGSDADPQGLHHNFGTLLMRDL